MESGSVFLSDGYSSYSSLAKHFTVVSSTDDSFDDTNPLKLVHLFILNAKSLFQGTFHGLGSKYIQTYFNEFAYRFNRRDSKTPIVEHLIRSCVKEGYTAMTGLSV